MALLDKLKGMFSLDSLTEPLVSYVEARLQLFKAEAKQEATKLIAAALPVFILAVLGFLLLIFSSLAIGAALNALLNSVFWGYVILTALYLIPFSLLLKYREHPKLKARFNGLAEGLFVQADKPEPAQYQAESPADEPLEDENPE